MDMRAAIQQTVPISLFNRGMAGKIFSDVRQTGPKVVMKNNVAECVLLSPEEYVRMLDELEDAQLAALAQERLAHFDPSRGITLEELDQEFGFDQELYDSIGEIEFE